jgi:hypothetical protein
VAGSWVFGDEFSLIKRVGDGRIATGIVVRIGCIGGMGAKLNVPGIDGLEETLISCWGVAVKRSRGEGLA